MAPRTLLPALLAPAALALALAACGSGSGDDSGPSGGTRTITDARGTRLEVPAYPRRVVTLGGSTLDGAIALGLRPIATAGGRGEGGVSSYLAAQARGIPSVGVLGRPNVEYVTALHPDLILLDATAVQDAAVVDELRRIAPTAYVARAGQDWRTAFGATASALNRAVEGRHVLDELDERVAQVREGLGENAGARVSVVQRDGTGRPSVVMQGRAAGGALTDLGLRLRRTDGDWLFFGAPGLGDARAALRAARGTPGFARLRAVRAGHVVPVDGSAWTSAGGPIAERAVVNDVAQALGAP